MEPQLRLNQIGLSRLGIWALSNSATVSDPSLQLLTLEFELRNLGYQIVNPDRFTGVTNAEYQVLTETLCQQRGGHVDHVPLFTNFPTDVPDDRGYLLRRVIGYWGLDTFWDKTRFGADPVTQMQDQRLYEAAVALQTAKVGDAYASIRSITLVSHQELQQQLREWALSCFYASTPVKDVWWDDLLFIQRSLPMNLQPDRVVVKETAARLAVEVWVTLTGVSGKTPTDLLRMLAAWTGQDVALATPLSFQALNLTKKQQKAICGFLERCPNLEEDLHRYQALWLAFLKRCHPGSYRRQDNGALRYPRLTAAYGNLKSGTLYSFEEFTRRLPVDHQLRAYLQRPGVLIRKLSELIPQHGDQAVAEAVLTLLDRDPLPLPLLMQAYCALDYQGMGEKLIINKNGRPWVGVPNHSSIEEFTATMNALDCLIRSQLSGTLTWRSVWIDPQVSRIVLPLNQRRQMPGMLNLARGTRLPITGDGDVLRMFIYWHQATDLRTDLDLSCILLNDQFQEVETVAWDRYGGGVDVAHSGDIRSAECGATEFIDINLNAQRLRDRKIRYAALSTFRFEGGEDYTNLREFHAGWMVRKDVMGTQPFDPKTVIEKVTIQGDGTVWMPCIVDMESRELIYVDLMSKGGRTIQTNQHFPKQVEAMALYHLARPTYGRLLDWYIRANAIDQVTQSEASVTIGIDDTCDINVLTLVGASVTSLSVTESTTVT